MTCIVDKYLTERNGFSLIELIIVMAIFSVVMAGLYSAMTVQMREGVKQYRVAESEMELGISKNIIERDLIMAGYGLLDDYDIEEDGTQNFSPRPVSITNTSGLPDATPDVDSDTVTLMGSALGIASRASQGWASVVSVDLNKPTFVSFNDSREDIFPNDRVFLIEPNTRRMVGQSGQWRFVYNTADPKLALLSDTSEFLNSFVGMTAYGITHTGTVTDIIQPYYAVRYYLGGTPPSICAPGTFNLLRAESIVSSAPVGGSPIISCVLDFQVSLGLDPNEDGNIDVWDNAGGLAESYAMKDLNKRLKQIRAYLLIQVGNRDNNYTYINPDPLYSGSPDKIRVGDLGLIGGSTGRDVQLTAEQRKYHWRMVTIAVTPRNIR